MAREVKEVVPKVSRWTFFEHQDSPWTEGERAVLPISVPTLRQLMLHVSLAYTSHWINESVSNCFTVGALQPRYSSPDT
jgi:hypothetical protein